MAKQLRTPEGKEPYKLRPSVAEAPLEWIKHNLGFRQFSCRGKVGVQSGWLWVCGVLNITRMIALNLI